MKTEDSRIPTDEDKLRSINLIWNRFNRGLTLYLWITRVHPMLRDHPRFRDERLAVLAVKNACVESVLMSVRDIDDFFRPKSRNVRNSDLLAEDFFGFRSHGRFLSSNERESINQWLAHLSYQPVWTASFGSESGAEKTWNTADLVGRAARAVFGFMEHLEHALAECPDRIKEVSAIKTALQRAVENMEALADLEAKWFAQHESG